MIVHAQLLVKMLILASMPLGWGGGGFHVGETRGEFFTQDEKVVFVIWANGCNGAASSSGPWIQKGKLHANDKREIEWSCLTHDGLKGKATIDGREYDLAKGGLFLVSTRDKKTKVRQLDVAIGTITQGRDGFDLAEKRLAKLAKENETIRNFVDQAGKEK